jgi:hypothetical protein
MDATCRLMYAVQCSVYVLCVVRNAIPGVTTRQDVLSLHRTGRRRWHAGRSSRKPYRPSTANRVPRTDRGHEWSAAPAGTSTPRAARPQSLYIQDNDGGVAEPKKKDLTRARGPECEAGKGDARRNSKGVTRIRQSRTDRTGPFSRVSALTRSLSTLPWYLSPGPQYNLLLS